MNDCFCLTRYIGWTANGRQIYGCRGIGKEYNQFWSEFSYKPTWEKDDWPWSYFALNEEQEAEFVAKYVNKIDEFIDEDSEPYDENNTPKCVLSEEQKQFLEQINKELREEIQKEINAEIIRTIAEKSKA